ncbi:imidazole glycerol phosphate synthase subunit HisF [Pedobacter sp. LMG 31464]|uniref:imidazole glycerol-phosphate synthase n=1 Tax=Pedobacter planticolens TaxID=2679964 RepID=A0A923DZH9_9SPHI|nr:imidazole glycerol phosphate synthase cyclase subunit [Pedobacter planticolens]MBB2145931.1 imidazole glycerol phosphate synthase subunit HisF [Pedobacter planticolens]
MLKVRIIPILTFNGFGLVKTKKFANPRMVGNPVQYAKVYNSRGVDELVFVDIFASTQKRKINLKLVADVIKECYMPVAIGGGIESINDINDLLKIGADKVIIKTKALLDKEFIKQAVTFFGSQCISIAVDAYATSEGYKIFNKLNIDISIADFIREMTDCKVGEFVLMSVDKDGMMDGFDIDLINHVINITNIPVIVAGGGGNMEHYNELFSKTNVKAVGSASIFHFTQFTPLDIKNELKKINIPVRI